MINTVIDPSLVSEGLRLKNYKELCVQLNLKVKSGKSKILQMGEVERYMELKQEGMSFIVQKVYNTPLPKIDGRGLSTTYRDLIQLLILNLLAENMKSTGEGRFILSKSKLLEELNVINKTYTYSKYDQEILAEYCGTTVAVVNDYFSSNSSSIDRALKGALEKLEDSKAILLTTSYGICYKKKEVIDGKKKTTYHHRTATEEELDEIARVEALYMDIYDANSLAQLYSWGQAQQYRRDCIKELKKTTEIHYYYKCYDVRCTNRVFKERARVEDYLLKNNAMEEKQTLNNIIITEDEKRAIKRHEEAKEQLANVIGKYKGGNALARSSNNYVVETKKVSEVVVLRDNDYVKDTLKEMRRNSRESEINEALSKNHEEY